MARDPERARAEGFLGGLFAPQWAGGWAWYRICFALAALLTLLPRWAGIGDVYGVEDMVFSQRPFELADTVVFTESTMQLIWGGGVAALVFVLLGGALTKPAVAVYLACSWLMLANEALNIKAYDRLLFWMALALFFAPVSERELHRKWRSPAARWYLILVFAALYGSTGWLKVFEEWQGWLSGEVLAYHLVHQFFGLKPLGVWVSTQAWITAPASWVTLGFECLFPLLVCFRRTNPWVLLAGLSMHLGILVLMNVGPFSYVAVAAYPALLHPEVARSWRQKLADAWYIATHPEVAELLEEAERLRGAAGPASPPDRGGSRP